MSDMDDFFQDARDADSLSVAQEICGARLKKIAANEYAGPCPSCGGRDRFSINIRKKTFNCRRCGAKGSNINLAMLAFGCAPIEAAERINGRPRPNGSHDETVEERAERLAAGEKRQADNQRREAEQRRIAAAKAKRDEEAIDAVLERALDLDNPLAAHGQGYLRARNLNPDKQLIVDIKFVPDLDYWGARENGSGEIVRLATLPAIVATIRDSSGAQMGLSQLWLDPVEPRKWKPEGSPQNSARKIRGEKQHGMICLGRRGVRLAVGEGWETCLAWDQLRGAGFFGDTLAGEDITLAAAIDLGNLSGGATGSVDHPTLKGADGKPRAIANGVPNENKPGWTVPKGVTEVWLLGDYDSEVFASTARMAVAARRLLDMGLEVHVHFPPTPGFDWNDQLLKGEDGAPEEPKPLPTNASYAQKVAAFRHPTHMETGAEYLARVSFLFDPPREPTIKPTRFVWIDPAKIPRRQWVYGWHYIRKFVSATVSPGGKGKTSLILVEALAIITGRNLIEVEPDERTNVWYWNGEDPRDEVQRRLTAAALRYDIDPRAIEAGLSFDVGRESKIRLVQQNRDGLKIAIPVVEDIIAGIRADSIGVLTIDPFVSCHEVAENDNAAIERVVTTWAEIADATNCAIELVHHTRKTNGAEASVEDGRGASSFLDKMRAARVINPMTKDEAGKAGVGNHKSYFRIEAGKESMSAPSEKAHWRRLESFSLANGDNVGVVVPWSWPDAFAGVTVADLRAVQSAVAKGRWRENVRATDWVGCAVASVLGLDPTNMGDRAKIIGLLKVWTEKGMFVAVDGLDERRKTRLFVEVGEWAND